MIAMNGDIVVGDYVAIGANAAVVSDVPSGAVVGGAPAKVIKFRRASSVKDFYPRGRR